MNGSPYDVKVGHPTMKIIESILDLEIRVASLVFNRNKFEIQMEPYCVHEDPGYKAGTKPRTELLHIIKICPGVVRQTGYRVCCVCVGAHAHD